MAKAKGPVKSHLPDKKNAPKKTGSKVLAGRPLDQDKDFEQPAKTAAKDEQPELLETPKEKKPTVVKGRFLATYLKPIFTKAPKTGDKLLALQMSVALTEEHEAVMPKAVIAAWKFIKKHGRKQVSLSDLPGQNVRFYMAHDDKEEIIGLPVAKMVNTSLAVIQKKGEGEALKVIRLQFRLQIEFSREDAKFAESNYGNAFWLDMKTSQEELFEKEDDE